MTRSAREHGGYGRGVLCAALAVVALLSGCAGTRPSPGVGAGTGTGHGTVVTISSRGCGTGWVHPKPGLQTFQLHNEASGAADVYLINPLQGSIDTDSASAPVYAEVQGMGPGTTAPMQVTIGSGAYAFECELQYYGTAIGHIVRVPGTARGTPAVLSVTFNDLVGSPQDGLAPARQYSAYVAAGLRDLAARVSLLDADIRSGDLARARQDWLAGHLAYERLGAAYGTFGRFDAEIDGRADGLRNGVRDPRFTGFYRLEYGLWHGQSPAQLRGPADVLNHDVQALRRAFPHLQLVLGDLGLRTHEILENALQFQLTGHDDYGSGTTLATVAANIAGTRELLKVLHPLIVTRYAGLAGVTLWLGRLQALIDAARHHDGSWTPVGKLSTSRRERIDAAMGESLQLLAPIASIFEVEKPF